MALSNTIKNEGDGNIIIQSVKDSTITVTVNGQFQEIEKKLDALIALMKEYNRPLQVGETIYNIGQINEATFKLIVKRVTITANTVQIFTRKDDTSKNEFLNLWIISTTRDKISADLELTEEVAALHHESDPLLWRPFYQEAHISELLESYQSKVGFEVKTRFLAVNPLQQSEESHWLKQLNTVVLLLDGFAIDGEQAKMIRRFNKDEVGGCLIPLCQSYPFAALEHIRSRVSEHLDDLHLLFTDFKEKYLHFVFPIPTKDLFFRTLTNLAIVHLAVSSKIEIKETHKTEAEAIRKQSFKF